MTREELMRAALEEAAQAARAGEVPVGAVVARDGEIISRARNRREERQDPTAHAEIDAIRLAAEVLGSRRLHGCSLYVTLEPCPMCAGAMMMAEMKDCFFAARDERQGCAESVYALPSDPAFYWRVPCYGGLLEKEAAEMLKAFFSEKRN